MNELAVYAQQLPDTLEDLSKFVLVGREKLVSVRAEIRAINRIHLAEEVRNQKREEAQMLSEAVLDAEVRLGDLLKMIPKAGGGDRRSNDFKKGTAVHFERPKSEVIKDLGLSEKQAQRFETLADNKDLVEQVKQEARENDDLPTRTRVIDLAQQRKKKSEDLCDHLEDCKQLAQAYNKAIYSFLRIKADEEELRMLGEVIKGIPDGLIAESFLNEIDDTMNKLTRIRNYLKGVAR